MTKHDNGGWVELYCVIGLLVDRLPNGNVELLVGMCDCKEIMNPLLFILGIQKHFSYEKTVANKNHEMITKFH